MSEFSSEHSFTQRAPRREGGRRSDVISKLRGQVDLFPSKGIAYATTPPQGPHRRTYPVRSVAFRRFVTNFLFAEEDEADPRLVNKTIDTFDAQAVVAGEERAVYSRWTRTPQVAYLDFVRGGQVAEVSPDGTWKLVAEAPVPFVRMPGMRPLPEPVRAEKGSVDALERLGLEPEHADSVMSWPIGVLAGLQVPPLANHW